MSLLVHCLSGSTRCLSPSTDVISVRDVKLLLHDLEGIPPQVQVLFCGQTLLRDDDVLRNYEELPILRMNLGLLGGKGGFGALLRNTKSKAGQRRMEDFSACRDLNGRRLRHVDAEKKLHGWKPVTINHRELAGKYAKIAKGTDRKRKEEFDVDTDEVTKMFVITFKYNKETLKSFKEEVSLEHRTFVKFSQQWLVSLKAADALQKLITQYQWTFSEQARLWIWGASGPESISRNRQDFKLRNLRRGLSQIERDSQEVEREMHDSVHAGLAMLKRKQAESRINARHEAAKRVKLSETKEIEASDEEEEDPFADYIQLKVPKKPKNPEMKGEATEGKSSTSSVSASSPSLLDAANSMQETKTPEYKQLSSAKVGESKSSSAESVSSTDCASESGTGNTTSAPTDPLSSASSSVPPPPEVKEWPPIPLERYSTPTSLEACGLEHLKSELTRRGLKCGGSLAQRAERLFLLKTKNLNQIDKKLLAPRTGS